MGWSVPKPKASPPLQKDGVGRGKDKDVISSRSKECAGEAKQNRRQQWSGKFALVCKAWLEPEREAE